MADNGADTLDTLSERLNEALRDAEDFFIKAAHGARAETTLDHADYPEAKLIFCKRDDTWGLYVAHSRDSSDGLHAQTVPLISASRRVRTIAAGRLEALYENLQVVIETTRDNVGGAITTVKSFLEKHRGDA